MPVSHVMSMIILSEFASFQRSGRRIKKNLIISKIVEGFDIAIA